MEKKLIIMTLIASILFVSFSGIQSERHWSDRERNPQPLREILSTSLAIGNTSTAERNPGLEKFCTSINDSPGGYCGYFTPGVPYVDELGGLN